jgi:fatty-acyl-CoA synthase
MSASVSPYNMDLDRNAANHVALSPLSFLRRSAAVHPERLAMVHGQRRITYAQFWERTQRLASALAKRGVGHGDCVAIMAPNVPAMLEAHFAVPLLGGVLNSINTRLDPATVAFILQHGEAKAVLSDRELAPVMKPALAQLERRPLVVDIADELAASGESLGSIEYEALLAEGDSQFPSDEPRDEWQGISLLYTSGTTGDPKGVVYHHRGSYLNALGNLIAFGLGRESVYLWTLPMFHCDGWCYTWAVTAAAATHVCLRRVEPAMVFRLIVEEGVTHLCGAPVVLNLLAHAPAEAKRPLPQAVQVMTGGAAPPSAIIENMERQGFSIIHGYGLTETYGPATYCFWQDDWSGMDLRQRAERMARQGQRHVALDEVSVRDPETGRELPWDGESLGEIAVRGNTVMKGYLKNPSATAAAFKGGFFRSGDLAVRHPDGYIEVKDRSKDIIISGGENISSLEVEEVLYRHPKVLEAAVVAQPDPHWGETPCAFVALKNGASATAEEIVEYCRGALARFKVPKRVVFGELPKTSTGKIQKFLLRDQAKAVKP